MNNKGERFFVLTKSALRQGKGAFVSLNLDEKTCVAVAPHYGASGCIGEQPFDVNWEYRGQLLNFWSEPWTVCAKIAFEKVPTLGKVVFVHWHGQQEVDCLVVSANNY